MDAWEAVTAEYAALEAQLADPRVHRDFRRARRLRRCAAALRPLNEDALRLRSLLDDLRDARDLAADPAWRAEADRIEREAASLRAELAAAVAARDPFDPYDVIVLIDAEAGCHRPVQAVVNAYEDDARARGWHVEHLYNDPPPHWAMLGITAGEEGPGPWSVLKEGPRAVRSADGSGTAHVTVLPEAEPAPVDPRDVRIDLYCTREPGAQTMLRMLHEPTRIGAYGRDPVPARAQANAMRVVWAQLAVLGSALEGRYQAVPQAPGGHLHLRAVAGRPASV
ncbi:PCRF domain-containing protein [Actinomadura montaniterrae]|uniref:PCRF domain-containing protein n=1 Tax=Actinomadura montaniterrae TaxID=1803903 RepID=A0A6L3VW22_9ACTN|nr:PCRF domain-containing protein [Actinomadura montaniterrae]KAB2379095.1 PCRF domain-containing protein [Actinomadura montaniterrae]